MQQCPYCKNVLVTGQTLCDQCGNTVSITDALVTRRIKAEVLYNSPSLKAPELMTEFMRPCDAANNDSKTKEKLKIFLLFIGCGLFFTTTIILLIILFMNS